jgi:hypothetical protein
MKIFKSTSEERETTYAFQRQLWSVATISWLIILGVRYFYKTTFAEDPAIFLPTSSFLMPLATTIIILAPHVMKLSKFQIALRSAGITLLVMTVFLLIYK